MGGAAAHRQALETHHRTQAQRPAPDNFDPGGKFQSLVIEDLNIKGMMAGLTPKAQADAGMGEIRSQLLYKGQWHHCTVVLADRFYPSSKTCSACRVVNAKLKRERRWQCGHCGTTHERNLNAAVK